MNPQRLLGRSGLLLFISVLGGFLLGAYATMFVWPAMWPLGGMIGAGWGLLTTIVVALTLLRKPLIVAVPLVYLPVFVSVTLNPYAGQPSAALVFAVGILLLDSVIAFLVLPNEDRHQPGTCRSCGYNLTGNISGVCPECGTRIRESTSQTGGMTSTAAPGRLRVIPLILFALGPLLMLVLNVSVRSTTPSGDDIEGLIRQLGEHDVTVTHRAKWQLVRHGRRPLLRALKDDDPTIRANAAHALALLKDREAAPDLIEALDDEDEHARYRVVYALGELRDDRADAELMRVAQADPSKFVQDAAREALEKIRRAKPMNGMVGPQ
jgi:hypothetical protein